MSPVLCVMDRGKGVAGGEGYEVGYFARKHGITAERAREPLARIGGGFSKTPLETILRGMGITTCVVTARGSALRA